MSEEAEQTQKEATGRPNFAGRYQHVRSHDFEKFLQANGANWMVRKMVSLTSPDLDITQDGDKFTIKLISSFMVKETSFTVGTDFEEKQHNGTVMKVSPRWDGEKLVLQLTPGKEGEGLPQTHTRELQGDEFTLTLEVKDVKATRVFKRVPTPSPSK